MATHLFPHHACFRFSLILVSLLTLMGILGGCGPSSTASSSHPTGSTSASTPIKELKGTITEFRLSTPRSGPTSITAGRDGNLWFTEAVENTNCQSGQIGRITPSGTISEFPLPANTQPGDITVGPDKALWYTELLSNKIGRLV